MYLQLPPKESNLTRRFGLGPCRLLPLQQEGTNFTFCVLPSWRLRYHKPLRQLLLK